MCERVKVDIIYYLANNVLDWSDLGNPTGGSQGHTRAVPSDTKIKLLLGTTLKTMLLSVLYSKSECCQRRWMVGNWRILLVWYSSHE
jgi:hypothetical protein